MQYGNESKINIGGYLLQLSHHLLCSLARVCRSMSAFMRYREMLIELQPLHDQVSNSHIYYSSQIFSHSPS